MSCVMPDLNNLPFPQEVLLLYFQKIWTAFLLHRRFRFLLYQSEDSSLFVSDSPFPSLQQKMYMHKLCHPVHRQLPCFCQVHSLSLFLPVRFPTLQKGNPPLLHHICLSECEVYWILQLPFSFRHSLLATVCFQ